MFIARKVQQVSLKPLQFTAGYIVRAKKRKVLPIYPPPEGFRFDKESVVSLYEEDALDKLDPTNWRRELIKKCLKGTEGPNTVKPGDIVRVNYITRNIPTFVGKVIQISRKGIESSLLLRNQVVGLGVEVRVKVFSPTVSKIDIIHQLDNPAHRNQLKHIRNTKLDTGDLEVKYLKKKFSKL